MCSQTEVEGKGQGQGHIKHGLASRAGSRRSSTWCLTRYSGSHEGRRQAKNQQQQQQQQQEQEQAAAAAAAAAAADARGIRERDSASLITRDAPATSSAAEQDRSNGRAGVDGGWMDWMVLSEMPAR